MHEIEDLAALDTALTGGGTLRGLRLQDLDLTGHEAALLARDDLEGVVVLGGLLTPALDAHLRAHGALVFPGDPHAPVDPYRATPYSPDELYAGLRTGGYAATPDARAYAWSRDATLAHDAFVTLLRAVHDDSMTDALDEVLDGYPVVGVMGGHALRRDEADYALAAALGHALARSGLVVATGGGPGAMEAANLGALAPDPARLADALEAVRLVPGVDADVTAWVSVALDARVPLVAGRAPGARVRSIGIPTWFYGHEPPNVFVDGIGKYFSNAIREDGLLARCTAGVVVLPGAAGTVQEVFQAATRLYYAPAGTVVPRLVLVGTAHWTEAVPVWPALRALGVGRAMAGRVHLVDDPADAVRLLTGDADGAVRDGS